MQEYLKLLKLPTKTLMSLCLATGVITVLPDIILTKLGLSLIVLQYRSYISLCFILTLSICIIYGATASFNFFKPWLVQYYWIYINKKRLHILTPDEKELLIYYIVNQTRSQQLDVMNGIVGSLERERIIIRASNLGRYSSFAYEIQPWAWEYLNKHPDLLK